MTHYKENVIRQDEAGLLIKGCAVMLAVAESANEPLDSDMVDALLYTVERRIFKAESVLENAGDTALRARGVRAAIVSLETCGQLAVDSRAAMLHTIGAELTSIAADLSAGEGLK